MQTKQTKAAKVQGTKAAPAKKANATETANVIATTIAKEQRFLYRFQIGEVKLLPAKAKQRRQKIRRQLDKFDARIRFEKNAEKRAEAIAEFNAFYKAEFILNDYSLKSLTDSKADYKAESYSELLKLVQGAAGKKA